MNTMALIAHWRKQAMTGDPNAVATYNALLATAPVVRTKNKAGNVAIRLQPPGTRGLNVSLGYAQCIIDNFATFQRMVTETGNAADNDDMVAETGNAADNDDE